MSKSFSITTTRDFFVFENLLVVPAWPKSGARQGICRLCHAWINRLSRSVFAMLTTVSVVGLSATVRIGDQFRVSLDHRDGLSVFASWYTA